MKDIYSDETLREFRKKNWSKAIHDFKLKKKYIMDKIKNIANNFNMKEDEVYNIIDKSSDEELKALFIAVRLAKDPKRQNIYELIFLEFLRSKGRNINKLPSGGNNALFLTAESIIKGKPKSADIESTKSLDFCEKIGDKKYYYYHKFTKDEGGAQDNQYIDLQTFVRIAKKYCMNNNDNNYFVAVPDDPFYNDERKRYLEVLAGKFKDKRIFIASWNQILEKIN
ncbi:MAG: hypothetical protein ACTSQG_08660 [Promethearchaeota archaeon]